MKKYRIEIVVDGNHELTYYPQVFDKETRSYVNFTNGALLTHSFTTEKEATVFLIKYIRETYEQKVKNLYVANKRIVLKRDHIYQIEGNEEVEE